MLRLYTGVSTWWNDLKGRAAEEGGATAVEYALMVALIAVVIIAAVAFIGKSASNQFSTVGSAVGGQADDHGAQSDRLAGRSLPRTRAEEVRDRRNERLRRDEHPSEAPS